MAIAWPVYIIVSVVVVCDALTALSDVAVIHERTIVVDAHAVAEGLLWQVISCMLYGDVHDRAAGQWHVLDSKRCCL